MKAIDYEVESTQRGNWLDITGGTSITLLDYFAGKAMAALVSKVYMEEEADYRVGFEEVAAESYAIANAMLKERNERMLSANQVRGVTGRSYG